MNISPVSSPSILQTDLFSSASVLPVAFLINSPSTPSTSIVDISGLGKLLSAASMLEETMSQPTATSQSGFASVLATAQLFVDTFNSFPQSGSGAIQNLSSESLGSLFVQVLDSQGTAASGNEKSILSALAEIGINYQAPSILNNTGQMTIDIKLLQSEFNATPVETSSLLKQAIQSIEPLASTALNGDLTTIAATTATATTQLTSAVIAALTTDTVAPTEEITTATIQLLIALASLTAAEQIATTTQPTATALLSATDLLTTPDSFATLIATEQLTAAELLIATESPTTTAQPIVTELPTTTTQPIATTPLAVPTTAVETAQPVTVALPATTTPLTTPVTAAPATETTTVVPTATHSNSINPIIVATNPFTAAAIAAYHLVDGIFDTGKPHAYGSSPPDNTYSKIWEVTNIRPIKLDLHV